MFHAKNGWFFERTVIGGVHIRKNRDAKDGAIMVAEVYLNHDEWASIIASVAAGGETTEKFKEAKEFHGRALGMPAAEVPKE